MKHILFSALLCSCALGSAAQAGEYKRVESARAALPLEVAYGASNRIALEGEEIATLVFDEKDLVVKVLKDAGEIFVVPKHTGRIDAFLSIVDGETLALAFNSKEGIGAQNIVLGKTASQPAPKTDAAAGAAPIPFAADDYQSLLKQIARDVLAGKSSDRLVSVKPDDSAAARLEVRLPGLKFKTLGSFKAAGFKASLLSVRNTGAFVRAIEEALLLDDSLAAVACTFAVLEPMQTGRAAVIEFDNPNR